MKLVSTIFLLLLVCILSSCAVQSPISGADADKRPLDGAWATQTMDDGNAMTQVLMFQDGYFTWTSYRTDSGAFQMTKGGKYSQENGQLVLDLEFHSSDSDQVGTTASWPYQYNRGQLELLADGAAASTWAPIDKGQKTALTGAWLFAGREQDGQLQRREPNQPRKTMKLLTGKRFQWIAYDTDTKQFYGTGGGTYTAREGQYVETILFFSRDDSRVGKSLPFQFDADDGEWHHSGNSSSGDPMYEVWARRGM